MNVSRIGGPDRNLPSIQWRAYCQQCKAHGVLHPLGGWPSRRSPDGSTLTQLELSPKVSIALWPLLKRFASETLVTIEVSDIIHLWNRSLLIFFDIKQT